MRKLSEESRLYYLRRRAKLSRRTKVSKRKQLAKRRAESGGIEVLPAHTRTRSRGKPVLLPMPDVLSLSENEEETLYFFERLREFAMRRRRFLRVDFVGLRRVTPGAALVLAAELDRWRELVTKRLSVFDIEQWNPETRALLYDMGLFSLLDVANPPPAEFPTTDVKFIRFRSGSTVLGELAKMLRVSIEEVAGVIPGASSLFDALTEAMTNVVHHAYPEKARYRTEPIIGRWWMAGSFDREKNLLTVMFFDQGKGIPYTLPRTHTLERIRGFLSSLSLVDDDSSRIKAAMYLGRSQTGEKHRGKGLLDIRSFVDQSTDGRLRILSGRGEYIYRSNGSDELRTLSQSIGGTLIQWEVSLPGDAKVSS